MRAGTIGILISFILPCFICTNGCFSTEPPSNQEAKTPEDAKGAVNSPVSVKNQTIEAFVGSASKPATEQAAQHFEKETGIKVLLHFGGSGKMLSQLLLGRRGDIYFPGSSDYMEKAKREKCVLPETEKHIVYLIPAINVPVNNPANIQSLDDLARKDVRVGIARPDSVCVGLYGVEVLQQNKLWKQVEPNIVTNATSCAHTAQLVALGTVDAVMGWRVFHYWNPAKIKTILIPPQKIPRIGYIPIAVSTFSKDRESAQKFIDYLLSDSGRAIFRSWHYLPTLEEARAFATPSTPVGGEWNMPVN
jgi:molybdate transport system substrate-binding protein